MKRSTFLRGSLAAIFALAIAVVSPAWAQAPFDPPGLDRAMAAKDFHVDGLMATDGVVGVGVGLTAGGQAAVVIMTESAGVGGLPRSLDGAPVVIMVTGAFHAIPKPNCQVDSSHPSCKDNGGNEAPTASFTYDCTDLLICDFNASGSTDDGSIVSYDWDFGDGEVGTGVTPNHDYTIAGAGTYSVTLTVTDDADATDSTSQNVPVGVSADPCDSDPKDKCGRPVPIGVSTGNEGACNAGTIAARLTDGTNVYALSNNHVYALKNDAPINSNVIQPGVIDSGSCVPDPADVIGTLDDFVDIEFSTIANNEIDAAIALSSTADLYNATPGDGYGLPMSATMSATINLAVQKYGRTTRLTTGTVSMINATVNVGYSGKPTARFINQIVVNGDKGGFIKPGDSGSLLVTNPGRNPVGMLFAGDRSGKTAIANHIDVVLDAFGVYIDGEGSP